MVISVPLHAPLSKEEATFLSQMRHFLCVGEKKSRSLFFLLLISAVLVRVLMFSHPVKPELVQVKWKWLQKAQIKTWACRSA